MASATGVEPRIFPFQTPFQANFDVRPASFEVLEERSVETVQADVSQGDSMIVSRDDAGKVTWSSATFPVIGDEHAHDAVATEGATEPNESSQVLEDELIGTEELAGEAVEEVEEGPCNRCEETEAKFQRQTEAMEARLSGPIAAAVEAMDEAVFQMNRQMHLDVVTLAKKLAETIIRKEVGVDEEILLKTTEEALRVAGPIQTAVIQCHPEDQPLITQHLNRMHEAASSKLVDLSVEAESDIERGGCKVRFADGNIDARLESQLNHLADTVKASLMGPRTSETEAK